MEENDEKKFCSNCKENISIRNYQMHEVHCKRHIVLCERCKMPVNRDALDDHELDYHTEVRCDQCGQAMENGDLDKHKEDDCPHRLIHCDYCDLEVKACDYQEHESICGSRTDECDVCRKRVMLRNMNDHYCNSKPRHNPYRNTSSASKTIHPHHPSVPVKTHPSISAPVKTHPSISAHARTYPSISAPVKTHPSSTVARHSIPPTRTSRVGELTPIDSDDTLPQPIPPTPIPIDTPAISNPLAASGSDTTMVFDKDWLDSVSMAVEDDSELDSVIASTAFQEDVRKKTKQYQDQFETEAALDDEELARKLQMELNRQRETSIHDSVLARRLQHTNTPSVVDSVLNDRDHAHQLYDTLEEFKEDDHLLARQLQEEEKLVQEGDKDGLSTMMIYDRSVFHKEGVRRQLESDHELATQLQEEVDIGGASALPRLPIMGSPHVVREESPPLVTAETTPTPPDQGIPCEICGEVVDFEEYQAHLETAHPFQSSHSIYRPSQGTDLPPLRLNPSPHYCNPSPSHDYPSHPRHSPFLPNYSPSPPEEQFHYDYRQQDEDIEREDKVNCEYCGYPYPQAALNGHMTICDENPEKYLKKAYQKPDDEDVSRILGTTIPCEFCQSQIALINLSEHQQNCGVSKVGASVSEPSDETIAIPCDNCGEQFPQSSVIFHQASCHLKFKRPSSSWSSGTAVSKNEKPSVLSSGFHRNLIDMPTVVCDKCGMYYRRFEDASHKLSCSGDRHKDRTEVACTYCKERFPIGQIRSHQSKCVTRTRSLVDSPIQSLPASNYSYKAPDLSQNQRVKPQTKLLRTLPNSGTNINRQKPKIAANFCTSSSSSSVSSIRLDGRSIKSSGQSTGKDPYGVLIVDEEEEEGERHRFMGSSRGSYTKSGQNRIYNERDNAGGRR